jgi:hypothetical protein
MVGALFHARFLSRHTRHRLTREHDDSRQHRVRGRVHHAAISTLTSNFTAAGSWHCDLLGVHDITLAPSDLSDQSIDDTFVPVRGQEGGSNPTRPRTAIQRNRYQC